MSKNGLWLPTCSWPRCTGFAAWVLPSSDQGGCSGRLNEAPQLHASHPQGCPTEKKNLFKLFNAVDWC
eukprot:5468702-Amphidinium_carterae.1